MPDDKKTNLKAEDWQLELDRVGFIRKMFLSRKWYGGDWWFILISGIILTIVVVVGLFPRCFAPYNPLEEVGPSFLPPGNASTRFELIVLDSSGIKSVEEITWPDAAKQGRNKIGYLVASQSSRAIREAVDKLNLAASTQNYYQFRPKRYESIEEGFKDLVEGKIYAFIASQEEIRISISNSPIWS